MTVSIERPMNNLTIVTIGSDLEFAFSYETVVAFRAPTNPGGSWVKSENVWSQTTGKHLNYLPGERIPWGDFEDRLNDLYSWLESPRPVGQDEHGRDRSDGAILDEIGGSF
jgi:hypothetical protein